MYAYDADAERITRTANGTATAGCDYLATLTIIDDETPPPTGDELYTYDLIGNIQSKTGVGTYSYSAAHPHAGAGGGAFSYTYDCDGNMLSGGGLTNSGVTETYGYDADGERITRATGGVITVYLGGLWEETSSGAVKQYYSKSTVVVKSYQNVYISHMRKPATDKRNRYADT